MNIANSAVSLPVLLVVIIGDHDGVAHLVEVVAVPRVLAAQGVDGLFPAELVARALVEAKVGVYMVRLQAAQFWASKSLPARIHAGMIGCASASSLFQWCEVRMWACVADILGVGL